MSVRTSSFISTPSEVIWSEWVRRCAVRFWIHASVLASFSSSCMGEEPCHVHLSPQGQLILTSVNGLPVTESFLSAPLSHYDIILGESWLRHHRGIMDYAHDQLW